MPLTRTFVLCKYCRRRQFRYTNEVVVVVVGGRPTVCELAAYLWGNLSDGCCCWFSGTADGANDMWKQHFVDNDSVPWVVCK